MLRPAVTVDADDVLARRQQAQDVRIVRAVRRREPRGVDDDVRVQREDFINVARREDAGGFASCDGPRVLAFLVGAVDVDAHEFHCRVIDHCAQAVLAHAAGGPLHDLVLFHAGPVRWFSCERVACCVPTGDSAARNTRSICRSDPTR